MYEALAVLSLADRTKMFHVKHFGTIGKPERSKNLGRKTGRDRLCILAHGVDDFAHDAGKSFLV